MNLISGRSFNLALCLSVLFLLNSSELSAKNVSIMAYNVENLFDYIHDPGKEDYTYLPLSEKQRGSEAYNYCMTLSYYYKNECLTLDWSENVFWQKLKNVAYMVRSYGNFTGPDIVVFEEVEKIEILQAMVDYELNGMGYQTVALIEGPDERGIDVGLISRFPLAGAPVLHPIDLSVLSEIDLTSVNGKKVTSGILEVPLKISGKKITIFGNHWPSQSAPTKARVIAARTLKLLLESLHKGSLAITVGDFNTTEKENQEVIEKNLLVPSEKKYFLDAYIECQNIKGPFCMSPPGSYYYHKGKEWNRLDRIFLSDSFIKNKRIIFSWANFVVYAPYEPPFLVPLNDDGTPKNFDPKTGIGFSDHLSVAMEFQVQ